MSRQDAVKITIVSSRASDEDCEVTSVPRIGELIRTRSMAAARVTDVIWDLVNGTVTVIAQ